MIWGIALLLLLPGAVLLLSSIRGRRIDDHPICRGCGFDLVGIYPAIPRCPECGDALSTGSVRIGNRRRHPAAIIASAIVLALGLTASGLAMASTFGNDDLDRLKPEWLLMKELTRGGSVDARDELMRRERAGSLSPASIRRLIGVALDVHGDPAANWDVAWPAFLQNMWTDGQLSDDDLAQYARQSVSLSRSIEGPARSGGYARIRTSFNTQRTISGPEPIHWSLEKTAAAIGSEDYPEHTGGGMSSTLTQHSDNWSVTSAVRVPDLPPGTHPARAKTRLILRRGWGTGPVLVDLEQEDVLEIEILPRETVVVELVTDPEIGRALRGALTISSARRTWRGSIQGSTGELLTGRTNILLEHAASSLPVDIAFDLFIRCGEHTIRLGTISANAGRTHHPLRAAEHMIIRDFECDSVDVILRPNLDRAEAIGHAADLG
jgi:hypothetical protein